MNRLIIIHNHGHMTLKNVSIIDKVAVGTVVDGGVTNRLFNASSYTPYKVNEPAQFPLYGRRPFERHLGYAKDGKWETTPTPGEYQVECTFCG